MHRRRGAKIFSLSRHIQVRTTATATKQAVSAHTPANTHIYFIHKHVVSSRLVRGQVDGVFPAADKQPDRHHSQRPHQLVSENGPRPSPSGLSQSHRSHRSRQRVRLNRSYNGGIHCLPPHPTEVSDPDPLPPSYNHEALRHQGNGPDLQGLLRRIPLPRLPQDFPWTSRLQIHPGS